MFVVVMIVEGVTHPILDPTLLDFDTARVKTFGTFEQARSARDEWIDRECRDQDGNIDDDQRIEADAMTRVVHIEDVTNLHEAIAEYLRQVRDQG